MATVPSSAFDRFNDALRSLDDQIQDLREQFDDRRKQFESEVRKRASDVETQIKKTALYRRAEQTRKDVENRVERARAGLFDRFGIASKTEVEKLNRKLGAISRRINELAREKDQAEV